MVFILFNPQVYVVLHCFVFWLFYAFLLLISIMRVWNKTIGNNYGGGQQVETQGNMIGQEILSFR